jgi:hypothetical protein
MRPAGTAVIALAAALGACRSPDAKTVLEVSNVETYWAFDSAQGDTQYIAPVVRLQVRNRSAEPLRAVQATATFRRKGEEGVTWGADWQQVGSSGHPLPPGQTTLVVLKSDARYFSNGPVEGMFSHEKFRDAFVEVFLRVGASPWTKFVAVDIERRVGTRSVQPAAP